jgi:L-threonylcarbamoyladenylate synthase
MILKAFSPGPITCILPLRDKTLFSNQPNTIGVRIPAHKAAREMIHYLGSPVSAPSANISGKPSFTRFRDCEREFFGKVDAILKAEEPEWGLESTVLDCTSDKIRLIRYGSIDPLTIQTRLGIFLQEPTKEPGFDLDLEKAGLISPGLKYRHYAPEGEVHLVEDWDRQVFTPERKPGLEMQNQSTLSRIARIGFEIPDPKPWDCSVRTNLEYAKNLYAFLVDCDLNQIQKIYCQIPKPGDLEKSILNRLGKAKSKL